MVEPESSKFAGFSRVSSTSLRIFSNSLLYLIYIILDILLDSRSNFKSQFIIFMDKHIYKLSIILLLKKKSNNSQNCKKYFYDIINFSVPLFTHQNTKINARFEFAAIKLLATLKKEQFDSREFRITTCLHY